MSSVGATTGKQKTPMRSRRTFLPELRPTGLSTRNSDQKIRPSRSTDQVTLGITAQSPFRAHIDKGVYDLDVGSGHPNGAAAIKGSFVQRLKSYVI